MRILLCTLVIAASWPMSAVADEWVTPRVTTVTAPGGAWKATVTPGRSDGAQPVEAKVEGPDGARSFTLRNEWMPVSVVVLDDGTLLTFDEWHRMGYGPHVAVAYSPAGEVRWQRDLAALLGQARVDAAPHSVSSIWWRKEGPEWSLVEEGAAIQLTLWDENRVVIGLADGSAEVVAVADVGDDPERLFARGEALAQAGNDAEAVKRFARALELDPDHLEAALELAQALGRLGQHAGALETLERAAEHFAGKADVPGYNMANLHRELALTQQALGNPQAAEAALRKAITFEPSYSTPVMELAELLWRADRRADVDTVMEAFYASNKDAEFTADMVVADIGGFYRRVGENEKALAFYTRIYTAERVVNQFAYADMADAYEATGKIDEAIAIHEQLIAHWRTLNADAFAWNIETSQKALQRLRGASGAK